jgi:hypothetical protein
MAFHWMEAIKVPTIESPSLVCLCFLPDSRHVNKLQILFLSTDRARLAQCADGFDPWRSIFSGTDWLTARYCATKAPYAFVSSAIQPEPACLAEFAD